MPFTIRQPRTAEEFKQYYHLRWRLLRAPWSQTEGSEVDDIEDQCFHFMAIDDNNAIIAVARLQFNSNSEAQIRYMAVDQRHERQGIGRQLINTMEVHAIAKNCTQIVMDARESAIEFYKKSGYQTVEKTYLLFDEIQHYRMIKRFTKS